MSNNNSRRLPVAPPRKIKDPSSSGSVPVSGSDDGDGNRNGSGEFTGTGLPVIPKLVGKPQNGGSLGEPSVGVPMPVPGGGTDHFTNVFDDDSSFFADVPRVLVVNEQPFFRWFKRVFLALAITTVFLLGVTFAVQAPLEIGLTAIAAVWILVLAFSVPDAIIPFKKTRFDLTNDTVRVGQAKPRPLSDIRSGLFTSKKKNSKLWLGFDDKKDGFNIPLTSSKITMKKTDLLALRTIIPKTSITPYGVVDLSGDENKVPVTQQAIVEHIEHLMRGM